MRKKKTKFFFHYLESDGNGWNIIQIPGGAKYPASSETIHNKMHVFKMDGRDVWEFATKIIPKEV